MTNVVPFDGITRLNTDPAMTLERAKEEIGGGVVVIGWDKEENIYFASSLADGGDILWLLEKAKKTLLEIGDE